MEENKNEKIEESRNKKKHSGLVKGIAIGVVGVIAVECIAGKLILEKKGKLDLFQVDCKIKEIENLIDHNYLYDANKQDISDGMFMGMVYGLTEDNYSAYYSKSVYDEEKKRLNGNYVGIGVTVSKDSETGGIYVNAVNSEGPAAKAGVQVGDIITEADGMNLTEKDTDYAVSLITGDEGTIVHIKLLRNGEELEFDIERANITTVSVKSEYIAEDEAISALDGDTKNSIKGTNIGYISVSAFNQATKQEFMDELDYLSEDKQVDGIIIDLRNNGGGDLNVCLEMLDMILADDLEPSVIYDENADSEDGSDGDAEASKATDSNAEEKDASDNESKDKSENGSINNDKKTENAENVDLTPEGKTSEGDGTLLLSVESKTGSTAKFYAEDGWSSSIPIVVLVNGSSASASEIFAGTLRDYGYQVIGTKTFGKGIVQSLYELTDGSAVKFTTEQYRLAGGELIHGKGINPTIEVPFEEYDDVKEENVNYANGSAQPDMMKDKQIAAAVKELERQVYEAYQNQ